MQKIFTIAHRGDSGAYPENTILAISKAFENSADIIEMDVQITKDQNLVLFHDRDMMRITNESKQIADFTLNELKQKDMGIWKGKQFEGIYIARFRDILTQIPSKASFIVEVKPQKIHLEDNFNLERLILEELDDVGRNLGNGYISVRSEESFEWITSNSSKYPVALMQKKRGIDEYHKILKAYGIKIAQIRWRNYSQTDINELKSIGCKIMAFYGDEQKEWDQLIDFGVDGIFTNYPSNLHKYLNSKLS